MLARLDPSDSSLAIRYLRAPFSGTVAEADVAVGDTVTGTKTTDSTSGTTTANTADATTAFTMVKLSRYDLTVSLSESDIGKVKVGQMATVTVDATGDSSPPRSRTSACCRLRRHRLRRRFDDDLVVVVLDAAPSRIP